MYNPYSITNKKKHKVIDKILKFDDKRRLSFVCHPDIEEDYKWILSKMRESKGNSKPQP